ncbi:PREDICTED: E3 ubiquitin-protein ligase TRIM71-like [Acropora digitifera]|uniref:E3 ubiquitin-protein ligase TRIM71-like n=1 Tax=Acropora digitifera TaxID=70779 RepID=UPI000779FFFF|nr:PREDICTED: E3 ubiquitin-protein ligase TRIM71-like [Acropora digitifera]
MCLAEFDDSEIGRESNVVVVTRDSGELQCYQRDDQIKVDILTAEGDHLKTELKDSKDGKYTVTYTPQCVGRHSVEIEINGQPLTGSPFLVQIRQYQFSFQFGLHWNKAVEFGWISDISVSHRTGTIAVADMYNKRIQLFSSNGKFKTEVKLDGETYSVAFTDCGNLLTLVSGNNNKLHLFSEEGQFLKHINDKHLEEPQHLSVANDDHLIITDEANNEVKVLSPDGNDQLVSMTAPNCDNSPECAAYHQNKFYVSYPLAHCIKVFDKKGAYIHDIGCEGSSDGQLEYPVGLVIDKCNRLIVCDADNQRLQLFTLSGKFLSTLGKEWFNDSPWCAAINLNSNTLFVSSVSCNDICVFH